MTDIVERLREASVHSVHLSDDGPVYGAASCELLEEAADIITSLRSLIGKADVGESFAEIAKQIAGDFPGAMKYLPRNEPNASG